MACIWNTIAWTVWKARNNKKFKGRDFEEERVAEEAKVLSWRWIRHKSIGFVHSLN